MCVLSSPLQQCNGCLAHCRYAFCKKTSQPLAIKTYKKRKLSPLNRCQVAREIHIHSQLDHPNIIALVRAGAVLDVREGRGHARVYGCWGHGVRTVTTWCTLSAPQQRQRHAGISHVRLPFVCFLCCLLPQ